MPAEEEPPVPDVSSPSSSISLTPYLPTPSSSSSEHSYSNGSDLEGHIQYGPASLVNYIKIEIPEEQTLRELLRTSTGSQDLKDVTRVKLQVIAVDVCLQHLDIHTPSLAELILDGSVLSSLRDLGCGLRNLKILRVARCGLTSLDGMFGLQSLEELCAARNRIQDLSPCSYLPHIKHIDLKRNCIKDISSVSFLALCATLEHLELDENEDVIEIPEYRQIVKALLPRLTTLDGKDLADEKDFLEVIKVPKTTESSAGGSSSSSGDQRDGGGKIRNSSAKRRGLTEGSFTVRFPPKILSPRPSSTSSSDSNIMSNYRSELPGNDLQNPIETITTPRRTIDLDTKH